MPESGRRNFFRTPTWQVANFRKFPRGGPGDPSPALHKMFTRVLAAVSFAVAASAGAVDLDANTYDAAIADTSAVTCEPTTPLYPYRTRDGP